MSYARCLARVGRRGLEQHDHLGLLRGAGLGVGVVAMPDGDLRLPGVLVQADVVLVVPGRDAGVSGAGGTAGTRRPLRAGGTGGANRTLRPDAAGRTLG